ncbi:MAG TPA: hypothetical protein VML55_23765 [Planctomycetaceae bacterium]|nr:hypothetical protein [Planctomycetaceae bacterium]
MKRPLRHLSAVLGTVAICLGAAAPGHACGFFAALFGHHHQAHYAPAYSSFYAPPVLPAAPCCAPAVFRPVACCPSPCDPCGAPACAPCGPLGCPAGACDVGLAPPLMQPFPDAAGARPRTFVDDPQSPPRETPPMNDGFLPRGSADDYDRDPPPNGFGPDDGDSRTRGTFRPESVIPPRDPPPSRPAEPAIGRGRDTDLRLPAFNLGDRITWRERPERTRLIERASFAAPVVARNRTNPNTGWLPVADDTRLVHK